MATELNDVVLWVGGGGGFVTAGLILRKVFGDFSITSVAQKSIENGMHVGDKTIANMQAEMERMGKRIAVLEKQVEELTSTLANVRVVALDCFTIVVADQQMDREAKERLVAHLKTIIKDS